MCTLVLFLWTDTLLIHKWWCSFSSESLKYRLSVGPFFKFELFGITFLFKQIGAIHLQASSGVKAVFICLKKSPEKLAWFSGQLNRPVLQASHIRPVQANLKGTLPPITFTKGECKRLYFEANFDLLSIANCFKHFRWNFDRWYRLIWELGSLLPHVISL